MTKQKSKEKEPSLFIKRQSGKVEAVKYLGNGIYELCWMSEGDKFITETDSSHG